MSGRPIFVATHPRSCSTAFERVFLTRSDDIACAHEPFGDAFYYGPERLGHRFAEDDESRLRSGFADVTYKDVLDRFADSNNAHKRVFIKDMAYYLMPPHSQSASVVPSLAASSVGSHDQNPSVIPLAILRRFHFAFLIRHPRHSIPSYYRCTVPPLVQTTEFHDFLTCEAGYAELRRLFDYLRAQRVVGGPDVPIVVIDADDLLDRPTEAIDAFCRHVGLDFTPDMMRWEDDKNQQIAATAFEKWAGFHDDALASTGLKARISHRKQLTEEEEDEQWKQKYGDKGQKLIRKCVTANTEDYEYLKSFSLKF
ncbi:hypothetical protein CMQ_7693 [Grosmannia clavigera kw1407]|uniref:Uncharacterized protein n=1 Tax=Grosmannia clavigera (strain kw1407 / UAMH 11150) TaxID=655863 RepID=F0XQK5_GROCL|nr:uncharacterized protein CMQ_7693 [Grosmannia clavigera kw1407]EFX00691.1 hypothetical protein CMQ_7693 [Grosmannia clavigera kw1407]